MAYMVCFLLYFSCSAEVKLKRCKQCVIRYQYDPNGRVRDAMAHIWAALVPEPKVALDAHFGDISDELLKEMGGRMWRSREAACLALADLIQVSNINMLDDIFCWDNEYY